jgi:glycosyltransferase involved in cell wall biosynthesis
MPDLRIAFLDSWLQTAAEGSGTAVGIGGLAEALRALGHTVDRIAPPPDALPITLRRLRFNATLPRTFDPARYDLVVGFDIDGVWLRRENREPRTENREHVRHRSSIVHRPSSIVHRPSSIVSDSPIQNPYICSVKGVIAEEALAERGRVRLLFKALARLEGRNTRQADRVVTTSKYCRRKIHQHYRTPLDRIDIVPEGIDVGAWRAALATIPARTDDRPTVLCVARHYPRKRITDLVAAIVSLQRYLPDVQLRIVGDGPERANLEAQARALGLRNVAFVGSLPDAELKREYAHADVFCLPSTQEGFGIVFLEAMVAGLPIVSTTAAA